MPDDVYHTLSQPGNGLYTEKRSRFLGFALHVETEDEAKQRLEEIRKKHYDARHVCYAYSLGSDNPRTRANDDGEPSGTAGRPILGQLHAFGVTDVLVAVVRYFGGVKLGTGGLTVAYKTTAAEALRNAEFVDKIIYAPLYVEASYADIDEVMRKARGAGARIEAQEYTGTGCRLNIAIRRSRQGELRSQLLLNHRLRLLPAPGDSLPGTADTP